MKIFSYRGAHPNFGDELNHWLWPKLLPDFFDGAPDTLFVGIGSTIGDAATHAGKKIIFGAGFVPQYHPLPQISGAEWDVYFVRGPRTAARLGLEPTRAITDAGVLIRAVMPMPEYAPATISFMPHWQSLEQGQWQAVCDAAGVTLIDPRQPVEVVLAQLLRSRLVIAEAMHGAIIADALRVPWLPVVPLNPAHREKWFDWAESLEITLQSRRLLPSSIAEVSAAAMHGKIPGGIGNQSSETEPKPSRLSRVKRAVQATPIAPWLDRRMIALAASRMRTLAQEEGQLSDERVIAHATERMLEKLEQLKRDYPRAALSRGKIA